MGPRGYGTAPFVRKVDTMNERYKIVLKKTNKPVLADMRYMTRLQAEAIIPVLEEDHPEFRGKLTVIQDGTNPSTR